MVRTLRSGQVTPVSSPVAQRVSTPALLSAAEKAIAELDPFSTEEIFESPVGSLALGVGNTPGTGVATPSLMQTAEQGAGAQSSGQQQQQQQQQAAGPGGIHSSIATLLQEHGLGTPSPTAAVGYSFDPSWVTHRADNPVPRGPVAGEFCSAFNLEQDPRFQVISKGGSGANRVEAELLSWVLSYSFDILGFITEAKQQGNPEVLAQALGTVHAQYSAVHGQLEQRIGELWARATYPNNPPLLEAIDRKRCGVGAGITLHSNITSVIEDLSRVQMQVAVKAAAQAVVSKRTDPPRNPGGGRGDPGGRGGGGRGGGRDGGREGGRDGGRGGGRAR